MTKLKNIHPGEVLLEEFLKPLNISQNKLANSIGVPPRRINEIVLQKRSVTPDTSIRLAKFFKLSDGYFLGIQEDYDLAETKAKIKDQLKRIKPLGG